MGAITLTPHEHQRLMVLNALQRGTARMADAVRLLGLSARQIRRLRRAYQTRGAAALAHGNRGRPSPRRLPAKVRARILHLARTTYAGVNHQHLTELLAAQEQLHLSRPTLHRLLKAAGLRSPRTRRPPRHRTRRERMAQEGMLVQFDGSHHRWLEDRGPKLVLHAAVDDATGKILGAHFDTVETAAAYLEIVRQIALGPGLPLACYTDRHGIFTRSPRQPWTIEEQLRGRPAPTQVGRVLHELGIRWIPAGSPQAKGRIERLFGALQDRLVAELRMAGIRTREEANAFLGRFIPRYNARFAKPAAHPQPVYRRWPKTLEPESVFCFKYLRTVANDHTVALGPQLLQIIPNGRSLAKARVELHQRLDGSIAVVYRGHPLAVQRLNDPPAALRTYSGQRVNPAAPPHPRPKQRPPRRAKNPRRHPWTPPPNHPWRQYQQLPKWNALLRWARTESLNT